MSIGRVDWKYIFENSNFWAVQVAKEGIKRAKRKNKRLITVRCANTPTGVLHIGNANDVIRAYFIAKSIEVLGYNARVVFTSDDRDPIRGFPKVICDKDGNLIEFPEELRKEFEEKYDGYPVFAIPDPFKCHSSWSEHFLSVYFNELKQLGILDSIRFEYYSPNVLYHTGEWDKYVKIVLENKEKVKKIYEEFKERIREYPFSPICQNCGRIGTTYVINYNPETGEIEYICEKRHLKKKTVQGCGYKGKTTVRFGKVDWYIEWAIDWVYFDTDIEPMGKDHWISSFRISPKFSRELFNFEEPIPVPYEFFTVNGKKMSGSKGNLWNITEMLKILEPEVFLYLYTKRPMSERDIDLKRIHLLVQEFDNLERKVLDTIKKVEKGDLKLEDLKNYEKVKKENLATFEELVIYYLVTHGKIKKRIRIPYQFCAVLGQVLLPDELLNKTNLSIKELNIDLERYKENLDRIKKIVEREYKINMSFEQFLEVLDRIRKATYWAKNYGPEYLRFEINKNKIEIDLDENDKKAIKEIIDTLENIDKLEIDFVQTKIHNIIKERTDPKKFYKKLYKILINKEAGPKIGSIVVAIGKEKVIEILKRYI